MLPGAGSLDTGTVSYVGYSVDQISKSDETDLFTTRDIPSDPKTLHWDGEWVRSVFQSRPKTSEGWIWSGTFGWYMRQSGSTATFLEVKFDGSLRDAIDGVGRTINKKTILILNSRTEKRHTAWEFNGGTIEPQLVAKLMSIHENPPTEKSLGIPLYPGATLVLDELLLSPGDIGFVFPYTTRDPVDTVVAFYEKRTGLKPQPDESEGIAFLIKGKNLRAAEKAVTMYQDDKETSITLLYNMAGRKLKDTDAARLEALKKKPPTEKEVGLPIYPNAQFDLEPLREQMLAGTFREGGYFYITKDAFEKVIAFYEGKLGQKMTMMPTNGKRVAWAMLPGATANEYTGVSVSEAESGTAFAVGKGTAKVTGIHRSSSSGGGQQEESSSMAQSPPQNTASSTQAATPQSQQAPRPNPLFTLARTGRPDEIQAAITAGAKVGDRDESGMTALMYAAAYNPDEKVISVLILAGANVDESNADQMTALMLAARSTTKPAVVQALINAHANMKVKDKNGKTAFDYATSNRALAFTVQLAALGIGRF